ncbi:MAG TPA: hypothetical protein VLH56_15595, partial [Dissulfurispiraceae bacterium]|nr:hypothetical protein [Dissulfurispiraceae bacterium]
MQAKTQNKCQGNFFIPKTSWTSSIPITLCFNRPSRSPDSVLRMGSLKYYSEMGRPAKPIRLMVGLMILKTVGKSSAMNALSRPFVQNSYYQA